MFAFWTLDLAVTQVNLILVSFAFGANIWAATFGPPRKRALRGAISTLCAIYIISYVILLHDFPERILVWSRVMRGVSIVAWVAVWILPAIQDMRIWRARQEKLNSLVSEVEERLKGIQ